ncbi:MAG: helix-turn-helix domain-containing protein [Bacillota bacterium]
MQLLRVPHVARVLDVTEDRVYQLVREGLLPAVRVGRQIRFDADKLRDWIEQGGCALPGGWRREA